MFSNIYDILLDENQVNGDKIAVRDNQNVYSYSQMRERIDALADVLEEKGLQKGDRVALYLPNGFPFIISYFACSKKGIICVPLNWINNSLNISYILKDSGCSAIISYENKIQEIISEELKINILFSDICIVMISCNEEVMYNNKEKCYFEDINMLLYTSGSTGQAKGVMLTHYNIYIGAKIVVEYLKMNEEDIILSLLPFSFDYGLNQLISTFLVSGTIVIRYPFLIYEVPRIIEEEKITGLAGIPTIWINLLNQRNIKKYNYDSLRYITNSGEAIPERYLDVLDETFPKTDIYLMYGLTECFRCTYLEPEKYKEKRGSIGKAIPGCQIMIVNEEGKICKANEVGELYFRGPTVSKGYWGKNDEAVFISNPFNHHYKEMIVRSGDLVYEDHEGYLFFVGRKDKMIKKYGYRTNGFQIANEILKGCSFVKACCVIGINDADGQQIVAFVELNSGENIIDRNKDIQEYSKRRLPMFMRIDNIIILDNIPKLNSNKYDMNKLEAMAIETVSAKT